GALLVFDPASSPPQHGQCWQPYIACAANTGDAASGLGAVLVRPDGIVAWACGVGGDMSGLDSVLASWTGLTR
ncbi:aromatic-ring hydroxylase C-terminal domain-containing protein, partial [Escherichia coli]|uniref:aromatic-ring hydroxylase C-terminal domain-containing protein n=2 Tax=Gammaproteobacteria TaxID=1236 RepID=UPI00227E1ABD